MLAPLLAALLLAPPDAVPAETPAEEKPVPTAEDLLKTAEPLDADGVVLLDAKNRRVLVKAEVVLRAGALEMLVCLPNTKEHESVLRYPGEARTLHAGLVALGLEPGTPVRFSPEFVAPTGPVLDLAVYWTDREGTPRTADARTWVRTSTDGWREGPLAALPRGLTLPPELDLRYDAGNKQLLWYGEMSDAERDAALALTKDETVRGLIRRFYEESQARPMTAEFVFVGSGFYEATVPVIPGAGADGDEKVVRRYAAEGGEVVCVANFQTATIDVNARSSAEGQGVLYEAATEKIPPEGTPVLLTFTPREKPDAAETKPGGVEPNLAAPAEPAAGDRAGPGD